MKSRFLPTLAASLLAFGLPASGSAETLPMQSQPAPMQLAQSQTAHPHGHPVSNPASDRLGHGGSGSMAGMPMRGGQSMMGDRGWLHGLGLSEAQNDKVFEIMHAQAPKMREQGKAVRAARAELAALSTAPNLDAAQLKSASDKLARALADMSENRVRTRHQIFQVLTPEQRKQVEARMAERQHRGGHAGGMRHDGSPRGPGQPGQAPQRS